MKQPRKRLSALIVAIIALAATVTSASANHVSISSQGIRGSGILGLSNTVNSNVVRCPITLEGSVHSTTISKIVGALVGYVTRASMSNAGCTGGTGTIHQESLPWHVTYQSFTGTLPNITSARFSLLNVFFEIRESGGNTCSARTEVEHPANAIVNINTSTHVAESLTMEPNTRIPLTNGAGGIFCGLANGIFEGTTSNLTVLGSTSRITVTLI